jgi:hypothetical protein
VWHFGSSDSLLVEDASYVLVIPWQHGWDLPFSRFVNGKNYFGRPLSTNARVTTSIVPHSGPIRSAPATGSSACQIGGPHRLTIGLERTSSCLAQPLGNSIARETADMIRSPHLDKRPRQ